MRPFGILNDRLKAVFKKNYKIMDSIYLISKNTVRPFDILNDHLKAVFKGKYKFAVNYYSLGLIPSFKIFSDLLVNDTPTIWLDVWNDEELYDEDDIIRLSSIDIYYRIAGYMCRDTLYLLEYILKVMDENPNYLIQTVEGTLLDINELKKMWKEKNINWMYI